MSTWIHAWGERLTAPLQRITDPDVARSSRLLSTLLLTIIVLVIVVQIAIVTISPQVRNWEWLFVNGLVDIFLLLTYVLSRRGLVERAALGAIVLCICAILVPAHVWGMAFSYNSLYFLVVVPLISAVFLSLSAAVFITVLLNLAIFVSIFFFTFSSPLELIVGPLLFTTFMSAILIAVIHFLRADADSQRRGLAVSEQRYRLISEMISDYAYLIRLEPGGKLKREWITEESYQRITRFDVAGLDAMLERDNWLDEYPEEIRTAVDESFRRAVQGQANSQEMYFVTRQGEKRWLHMYRQPIQDAQGKVTHVLGVAQDITARKEAEMRLRESEERYRALSELMSDYAFFMRVEGGELTLEWMTDSFERLTGYHPDEIFPNNTAKLFHPDDIPKLLADIDIVMHGSETISEVRMTTKQGQAKTLIYRRRPVWDDAHKAIVGYYTVVEDITERKLTEAQERKLQIEEEQLRMVRQFMLAISHDFRTLLANIETSRYLTERSLPPEVLLQTKPKLDRIHHSVKHISAQLDNLQLISLLSDLHKAPCDVSQLLSDAQMRHSSAADERKIHLICRADAALPHAHLDQDRISTALDHLMRNALTNTPGGGTIEMTAYQSLDDIIVEVRDTGSGIAPEDLPHIFEAFYRSDSARQVDRGGLGLGLTLVKLIVEGHGGSVSAQTAPGKGSCFQIRLPLHGDE